MKNCNALKEDANPTRLSSGSSELLSLEVGGSCWNCEKPSVKGAGWCWNCGKVLGAAPKWLRRGKKQV